MLKFKRYQALLAQWAILRNENEATHVGYQ